MKQKNGHPNLSPRVIWRVVHDEAVLLDLDSGQYYGLNPVGARVWQLLSENEPLPAICRLLAEEFDVSPDVAREDVRLFLTGLLERNLISQNGAR